MPDGYEKKFQKSKFAEMVKNDAEFKSKILTLIDEEVIMKLDKREGNASDFYEETES